MTPKPALVLASSSPWRRELLARLGLDFQCRSPDIDESPLTAESAGELVCRLAQAKARALAGDFPEHLIIGSDQVAVGPGGHILGKPGDRERAIAQLTELNGRSVDFHTGLCLLNTATGDAQVKNEPFRVHFRHLSERQIRDYVDQEEPYGCAGSFKSEGLGIVLFRALEGRDPNSLVGLPLILLTDMLADAGIILPLPATDRDSPG